MEKIKDDVIPSSVFRLRQPYISVSIESTQSYGGSQSFSDSELMRKSGCGVVAALDWLLYLQRRRPRHTVSFLPQTGIEPIEKSLYVSLLKTLSRRYLPILSPSGINGLQLAAGMNLLFLREHLPYRAVWRMGRDKLWTGIREMLENDYPVILSVGPNFPRLLSGKEKTALYVKDSIGTPIRNASVNSHYMMVTALEGQWLRISSWGKEYWLSVPEYEEYIQKHSNYVFSNILYIQEKSYTAGQTHSVR